MSTNASENASTAVDSDKEPIAEHRDQVTDHATTSRKTKTTKNGIELVPQPSDDPQDPLNWTMAKKLTIYFVLVFATFTGISAAVANVLATTVQSKTWNVTPAQAAYSVSAVLAGIIIGPVLMVPLVRLFGVMSCCFWSMILVAVTSVWSAVSDGPSDYGSFVASRGVAGLFCATPQIFISGVITNIFFLHQQGRAFGVYSTIYMIASLAGPSFSGYIVQYTDWPVCFWWTVGANALAAILIFVFGEDTLWDRERQTPVARKQMPASWWARRLVLVFPGTRAVPANTRRGIGRSFQAIFAIGFSPVTILAGIYNLIFYGWFIMAGVQVPIILQTPVTEGGYGFSPLGTSNFYFTAWLGAILGVVYGFAVNDRLPLWLAKRNGGVWRVEYRLHTAWFPSLFIGPIGYGLFGAANFYHTHWIVMAVGECFIVFAAVTSVPPAMNYIIEIWKHYPQEVGTALNVWRIGFSVSVQFFYDPFVKAVGVNWVWGISAFVGLFGFGCVVILMFMGPWLRRFDLWPSELDEEPKQPVAEDHKVDV